MNNTGLVAANEQNKATDKQVRTRSKFNLSYNHFQTARFGELNTHFVQECVPSDVIRLRSSHELRTFTLKAPLMQNIEIKKDYFNVPMEAILPLNWDKIYTNPVIGDDIDASQYGTNVHEFYKTVCRPLNRLLTCILDTNLSNHERIELFFRFISLGSLFFSKGSLMHQLGYHVEGYFFTDMGFDRYYNSVVTKILSWYNSNSYFTVNDENGNLRFKVYSTYKDYSNVVGLRFFLDWINHNSDWHLSSNDDTAFASLISDLLNIVDLSTYTLGPAYLNDVNIARVLAYQLVCAHYYTNDSVDYIYSADLYRQYIYSLEDSFFNDRLGAPNWYHSLNFSYNGISTPLDFLCARIFSDICNNVALANWNSSVFVSNTILCFYQYLQSLFGFQNSLRYLDYFVGSKTRPLAVGNVDVNVSGNKVNIIDVTRNIQVQKFLNSVNRTGRKFSNYIEGLFGNHVGYDYHNPEYIAHTADEAVMQEVENTGAAQQSLANSVTSIARSNASRYAFEFHCDRPSILIGIYYFDIARNYSQSFDKQLFHIDRFDMFNPYLQFIGDQEVKKEELDMRSGGTFGYQLRYAEYKQRINQLCGGFVDKLPGYAFDADEREMLSAAPTISPYFIRSHPWELDKFYLSLVDWSLNGYFHFIVKNFNDVEASRPMAFAPSIL